jgi:hypothetical protein
MTEADNWDSGYGFDVYNFFGMPASTWVLDNSPSISQLHPILLQFNGENPSFDVLTADSSIGNPTRSNRSEYQTYVLVKVRAT